MKEGKGYYEFGADGSMMIGTWEKGTIVERWWNGAKWQWVDHDMPPTGPVRSAPSKTINRQSFFVTGSDGGSMGTAPWACLLALTGLTCTAPPATP